MPIRPVVPPTTLTLVTVPAPAGADKVPPAESVRPAPTVTALGAADAVPGLPSSVLLAMAARLTVPDVVMGPPVNPVPVATLVTVPDPVAIEIVPPNETGVLLIVIALLAKEEFWMGEKVAPIEPAFSMPTPVMPV